MQGLPQGIRVPLMIICAAATLGAAAPAPKPVELRFDVAGDDPETYAVLLADGGRFRIEVDIEAWHEEGRAPSVIDVGVHEDDRDGWYFLRLGRLPGRAEYAAWMLGFEGRRSTLVGNQGEALELGTTRVLELARHDDEVSITLDGELVHESEVGFDPDYLFVRVANAAARVRAARLPPDPDAKR